jgi:hypothetical protein
MPQMPGIQGVDAARRGQSEVSVWVVSGMLGGGPDPRRSAVIAEIRELYGVTMTEIFEAAIRIRKQSPLVARVILRIRRIKRRWRLAKRRKSQLAVGTDSKYCTWTERRSSTGKQFLQCKNCGRVMLSPYCKAPAKKTGTE